MKRGDLAALEWAIEQAQAWRGYYTGGSDDLLDDFDKRVRKAKGALVRVKQLVKGSSMIDREHHDADDDEQPDGPLDPLPDL